MSYNLERVIFFIKNYPGFYCYARWMVSRSVHQIIYKTRERVSPILGWLEFQPNQNSWAQKLYTWGEKKFTKTKTKAWKFPKHWIRSGSHHTLRTQTQPAQRWIHPCAIVNKEWFSSQTEKNNGFTYLGDGLSMSCHRSRWHQVKLGDAKDMLLKGVRHVLRITRNLILLGYYMKKVLCIMHLLIERSRESCKEVGRSWLMRGHKDRFEQPQV